MKWQNYEFDFCRITLFGDVVKVVYHKSPVLKKGAPAPLRSPDEDLVYDMDGNLTDDRVVLPASFKEKPRSASSISRTRAKIREIALCNEFEYFCTLTLDGGKYKRDDLPKYRKDLAQFVRDYRKKYGSDVQYLFIPELHKDGQAWHIHGLIKGILPEHLVKFDKSAPLKLRKGGYLNFPLYQAKFGFCSFGAVKDTLAVSNYITKYISKSVGSAEGLQKSNKHSFFATQGLKRAKPLFKAYLNDKAFEFDYENDYVKIKTFKHLDDFLPFIGGAFEVFEWL